MELDWLQVLGEAAWNYLQAVWDFLQSQFFLTVVVGLATVVIGLEVNRWNRGRATLDIASRWNDGEVDRILAKYRDVVPWEPSVRYTRASLDELTKNPKTRAQLVTLLNHLDIVATGWYHGFFHDDSITHLYRGLIQDFYCKYAEFLWKMYQLSMGVEETKLTLVDAVGLGNSKWPNPSVRSWRRKVHPSMQGTYAYLLVKGAELSRTVLPGLNWKAVKPRKRRGAKDMAA